MLLCWCAPHAAWARCVLKTLRHRGQVLGVSESLLTAAREISRFISKHGVLCVLLNCIQSTVIDRVNSVKLVKA